MGTLQLEHLSYSKANEPLHDRDRYLRRPQLEFERSYNRLCDAVGRRLREETAGLDLTRVSDCVVCTSGLIAFISENEKYDRRLCRRVYQQSGIEPTIIVSGYECASWGYLLRYFQKYRTNQRILLIIMDINLPYRDSAKYNPAWEKTGFGMTILDFSIESGPSDDLLISHTKTERGYFEFLKGVKSFADRYPELRVSLPFFPAGQSRILAQLFGSRALPNLHGEYGHCFGSDPWVGIVRQLQAAPAAVGREVIAASFALAGYYCAARVLLSPNIGVSSHASLLGAT